MARPRSGEKYDAIMKATLQIGAEAGFHGLSMSKIAKAAGVATATIYIYFENIDAIINQLYVDLKELVFGGSMTGVKPYMGSRQAFGLIWRNIYDNMLAHNVEFRFLEQFTNSPYISQISKEEGYRPFSPVIHFFQQGMAKGDIKAVDIQFSDEELKRLDEVSQLAPEYPHWFAGGPTDRQPGAKDWADA